MYDETGSRGSKSERVMELLFRALKGESLSARKLADEYNVSTRSITRDIDSLKCFMADRPEIFYGTELVYSSSDHCYSLTMDTLLSNSEIAAISKILVGCRALNKKDLSVILTKLVANTSPTDRDKVKALVAKEILQYREPASDCTSVIDNIWKLTECIERNDTISIYYHKMDREAVDRRLIPISIMFSESYFYLIAYRCDRTSDSNTSRIPLYYRIDRISRITVHRQKHTREHIPPFDEGFLKNRSLFMWPGPLRNIKFEFSGPSVQAILDRIPTAKITGKRKEHGVTIYTIEAETYGDGIRMFLLSQGAWVKVLEPADLVEMMKNEIEKLQSLY